ncbi:MAG TPA: hypothetical protein VMU29_11870 [Smithella sp.]|nr:hypothetical protein [Smithella sp.]
MYNEKSKENLKMFSSKNQPKKNGRPEGSLSLTNAIKKILKSVDEKTGKRILDLLATATIKHAMQGKDAYLKVIMERLEGKVPDKTENTGKDGGPVTMRIIYEDQKKDPDMNGENGHEKKKTVFTFI